MLSMNTSIDVFAMVILDSIMSTTRFNNHKKTHTHTLTDAHTCTHITHITYLQSLLCVHLHNPLTHTDTNLGWNMYVYACTHAPIIFVWYLNLFMELAYGIMEADKSQMYIVGRF